MTREAPSAAFMRERWAELVAERDILKAVIEYIAESVIVRHVCLPSSPVVQGCCQTVWGCGVCYGEYQGGDHPDGRGVYAHKNGCPRK